MTRDFTRRAERELEAVIGRVGAEEYSGFVDRVGSGSYDVMEKYGLLSLKDDLRDADSYHQQIIDQNDIALSRLEEIFSDACGVESEYHDRLCEIIDTCRAFNTLLGTLADAIEPKGSGAFTAAGVTAMAAGALGAYTALFDSYIDWNKALENLLEEYRLKGEITDEDRAGVITLFERYNRSLGRDLDALLSQLPQDQAAYIKYLAYSADEPYRSLYLAELGSYTIGAVSGIGTAYFTSAGNTINVDMDSQYDDPRGAFTTFFHESGHALDYNFSDDGTYFSLTYRDEEGRSLQDVIYSDVEAGISGILANYTSDPEAGGHVMAYIMGAGSVDIGSLTETEKRLVSDVQLSYSTHMSGAVNEAASDIYGGVTGNIIHGSYGHWGDGYWYSSDGTATYSQSKELWAEYYSYCVTGNEAALESLREYFPEAADFMDGMAAAMRAQEGS